MDEYCDGLAERWADKETVGWKQIKGKTEYMLDEWNTSERRSGRRSRKRKDENIIEEAGGWIGN